MPAWTIPYYKSGVLPMKAYTKINDNHCIILFQIQETLQTMYTIIKILTTSPIFTSKCQHGQ